eukprot:TRINITY_DN3256_c0_g1_i1.p2 TRINITY_DN3256_c0_g1~~TRINITY_DN3256_c0_g1_i1.p2  ORF type:complete len:52 (-),score=7.56 TRINITY_DN3256_c0_g1_i1:78-233(-)
MEVDLGNVCLPVKYSQGEILIFFKLVLHLHLMSRFWVCLSPISNIEKYLLH